MDFDRSILSPREALFFDALKENNEVTVHQLIELVKKKQGRDIQRQNAIVCIKYLQSKIARFGYIIERISDLGAGQTAIYVMKEERFKDG